MKYVFAFLALLFLFAAAAVATTNLMDDGYPPARYQHDGTASLTMFVGQKTVNTVCGEAPRGWRTMACAFPDTDRKMVLPNPCSAEFAGESFARLACHELGHLNGWPGNHPRP